MWRGERMTDYEAEGKPEVTLYLHFSVLFSLCSLVSLLSMPSSLCPLISALPRPPCLLYLSLKAAHHVLGAMVAIEGAHELQHQQVLSLDPEHGREEG
jgi:hypothetical protein